MSKLANYYFSRLKKKLIITDYSSIKSSIKHEYFKYSNAN